MIFESGLSVTDESWNPPVDLTPGFNELALYYINVLDPAKISEIAVISGTFGWSNLLQEEFGVSIWPDNKPLVTLEGVTRLGFTVPEPGSVVLLGLGLLSVMTRRKVA